MAAGDHVVPVQDRSLGDVLHLLRRRTATQHEAVERTLDLLDPELERARLTEVLCSMHGFWVAAEAGLDEWAARAPADAAAVSWAGRRRAGLFAADLRTLGGSPGGVPVLPSVADTDEAIGRLYVLEGSTLGGRVIDRHLATISGLSDVSLRAFSPYGSGTGAMWAAFRRATLARVAAGGDADVMVDSACATFRALGSWCRPAAGVPA